MGGWEAGSAWPRGGCWRVSRRGLVGSMGQPSHRMREPSMKNKSFTCKVCRGRPGVRGASQSAWGWDQEGDPVSQCQSKVRKVTWGKAAHHRDLKPRKSDWGFLLRDQPGPVFLSPGPGETALCSWVVVVHAGRWSQSRLKEGTGGVSGDNLMAKRDWYI